MNPTQLMWYHQGKRAYFRNAARNSTIYSVASEAYIYWVLGWDDSAEYDYETDEKEFA